MFAKVFAQIFDSSIAEDWQVRHVFEDLLKLADLTGVVDMTKEAIARRTNVPIDIVSRAIDDLQKPDPHSRSREHEGRRLIPLDRERGWGWTIVNYKYYRNLASEEQKRAGARERINRYREKPQQNQGTLPGCDASVTDVTPVMKSNGLNAMQRQRQKQIESTPLPPEGEGRERMLRVGALFGRKPTTTWSIKEIRAFRETAELCPVEELELIEAYYRSDAPYLRRDLQTLLNNWSGEVDRATRWDKSGRASERKIGSLTPAQHIKILEEEIATHPANPEWIGYDKSKVTVDLREMLKRKRRQLAELKATAVQS